jgi:site-specific DNA-cytosine methylase
MRILIACERSGIMREAFRALGHDAWSCDVEPADDDSHHHLQGDVLAHLEDGWDMMVAHPPCTHLAVSGARWFKQKREDGRQDRALDFVRALLDAPIPRIALENPVSIISTHIRKPDCIVQPWMFGDEATKTTCWWLKGLPVLKPTNIVGKGERHVTRSGRSLPGWYNLPPSPDRARIRSQTFAGMAAACAAQWGVSDA